MLNKLKSLIKKFCSNNNQTAKNELKKQHDMELYIASSPQ